MIPLTRPRSAPAAALAALLLALWPGGARAQADSAGTHEVVRVVTDSTGSRLQVDGRDFLVRGMNWDYVPIGQNYAFDLWQQPEDVIVEALDREMGLLAAMGANTIRVYAGIPPRWVRYIRERYGIYTIINHTVGRYGWTLDGVWQPSVDYSSPRLRAALAADVAATVARYRGTPGLLMYLLGNENNYGLSWRSFEIEALPKGERDVARARYLYSLFGEIARATKAQDPDVPVAIANGDVQYVRLIAEECKGLDVFGANVYRGISARDLFQVVRDTLGLPVMFTEFGADAFNARTQHEDQVMQARYLTGQWREIYEKSAGHGQEGNAIGGCVFQWSDGWWKYRQEERLDVHDTNASWPNGGYTEDYVPGENNMNEEWWGVCAKGRPDARGLYTLYPRAACYALRRAWALDPYAPGSTIGVIDARFAAITPTAVTLEAEGSHAAQATDALERARVSNLRLQFETIQTGSALATTIPAYDKFQSFYADVQADPAPNVSGRLSFNLRGHVPTNPIDQIFYENRSTDRVKVYQSAMSWDDRWFTLDAFYRTGHFHWGYEGDFFGLYREANYGPNLDTYDAEAPVGAEVAGKRALNGFKLALGPQLWWGSPPAALLKFRRALGRFDATAVLEKDIRTGTAFTVVGSAYTPLKPTTKTTLHLKTTQGPVTIEAGGIWAGANYVDTPFQVAHPESTGWSIRRDVIRASDALGVKAKLSGAIGRVLWYAQAASMGLVAEAGPTAVSNYTDWTLEDTGLGNQRNLIGGFVVNAGRFQLGPNVLWQKPIVGPMPADVRSPGRPRDLVDDPFAVRANREMTGAEFVVSYDPTPATWLWAWDNDAREDAPLAGSLGFVYRHMPTNMDAAIGFFADGVTPFVFAGSTPPRDLWEVNGRLVSRARAAVRVVAHAFYGTGEARLSNDPRLVTRWGGDVHVVAGSNALTAFAKFNDWGPYDYYRDFNLTFPAQLMGDLSHALGTPLWFETNPQTRIGVRATWRSLDLHSPRYTGLDGDPNGHEWEFRTYVRLAL